jgi:hypothetical protein
MEVYAEVRKDGQQTTSAWRKKKMYIRRRNEGRRERLSIDYDVWVDEKKVR